MVSLAKRHSGVVEAVKVVELKLKKKLSAEDQDLKSESKVIVFCTIFLEVLYSIKFRKKIYLNRYL